MKLVTFVSGGELKSGVATDKGVADVVFATLGYRNQILANVHVSWLNPRKSREITVAGTGKMLTFALGRGLEPADSRVVEEIARQTTDAEYRFSSLVLGIVKSGPFQMRKGADGGRRESK